jgi:cobaltochelatase CobS
VYNIFIVIYLDKKSQILCWHDKDYSKANMTRQADTSIKPMKPMKPIEIDMPRGVHPQQAPKINPTYIFPDKTIDVMQDIRESRKVMLIGHTGCGKTSLIEQIASRIGQGVLRVNMNGQTTISDFVGFWTVKAGQTEWVDGALPTAMRLGLWLIVDEIDCADASILAALNAVLEPDGKLMLKERGAELVEPHENFRMFATANAVGSMSCFRHLYQGTNLMNEAFLDRWRVYRIDYLNMEQEARAIFGALGAKLDIKECEKMARVAHMARRSFEREEIGCTFSTRRLIDWAEMMCRAKTALVAARDTIHPKVAAEDATLLEAMINQAWEPDEGEAGKMAHRARAKA